MVSIHSGRGECDGPRPAGWWLARRRADLAHGPREIQDLRVPDVASQIWQRGGDVVDFEMGLFFVGGNVVAVARECDPVGLPLVVHH